MRTSSAACGIGVDAAAGEREVQNPAEDTERVVGAARGCSVAGVTALY